MIFKEDYNAILIKEIRDGCHGPYRTGTLNGVEVRDARSRTSCCAVGCDRTEVAFLVRAHGKTYALCNAHALRWTDGLLGRHRFASTTKCARCVYCGIRRNSEAYSFKTNNFSAPCWAS